MTLQRGDVVLVAFPNSDLTTYKARPALVVQDLRMETGIPQVVLVLIFHGVHMRRPVQVGAELKPRRAVYVYTNTALLEKREVTRLADREYRLWLARNLGDGYASYFEWQPKRRCRLDAILRVCEEIILGRRRAARAPCDATILASSSSRCGRGSEESI